MRLLNHVIVWAFCIFSTVTCYAGFDRLFKPAGEGTLPEKLVVTESDSLLYKDFSAAPEKIPPLTILWRLTIDNATDCKDPVIEREGKKYYCVGSSVGDEWGYVETTKVTKWMTRFVFAPLPPMGESVFRALNKTFCKKDFVEASDKQIDEATVANITDVPLGYASLAFVLNDESGRAICQREQGVSTNPDDFKKVMMYNFPISDGTTNCKNVTEFDVQESDIGLDIVFVIDTTGSMQPMIDKVIEVCNTISKQANETKNVHFGLVEYRDSESSDFGDFGARVVCALSESNDVFLAKLNALQVEGGGDEPEDVMLGLKTAVDSAKWHKYTSKHIILIGDAPNKATREAGTITNFRQLFGYTNDGLVGNVQSLAFDQIMFHAIVGGDSPATAFEFCDVANNNGRGMGYFGNMSKNPNVTAELSRLLKEGIISLESKEEGNASEGGVFAKSVWNLKKMVRNGQDAKISGVRANKVLGFACVSTNKEEKCASLCVLVLRDELEAFEDALTQTHRRLNKLLDGAGGNIKVIFDVFQEEYVGLVSGITTDDDFEMNLEEIIGLQIPVKIKWIARRFKDLGAMCEKGEPTLIDDVKKARDNVKKLLNQKERWIKTYIGPDGRSQEFALIPIEDLP